MNTDKATPPDGAEPKPVAHEAAAESAEQVVADIAAISAELEDVKGRNLRLMADFQNYQKRSLQNELVARTEGVAKVASSVVGVLDHFDMALVQDPSKASVEQMLAGLRVIRDDLIKSLQSCGVSPITPAVNDEFLPGRHEAVMQQAVAGVDAGRVSIVLQSGYLLTTHGSERVLRPAKVAVAPTA